MDEHLPLARLIILSEETVIQDLEEAQHIEHCHH
jgi:hypothetical protein